jgi:hypothetical protein
MEPTAHQRLKMAKTNLTKLGVDALLKLRDDIEAALLRRSGELRAQLARLGGDAARKGAKTHSLTPTGQLTPDFDLNSKIQTSVGNFKTYGRGAKKIHFFWEAIIQARGS